MWWILFWACNVDLSNPRHPILESWDQVWTGLLATHQGAKTQKALDELMPKSQIILARKP
jgi:hypothetical protein